VKISVSLPSIYPEALARTIENIRATVQTHDVEIVVCSPFEVSGGVTWTKDATCRGNCPAHRQAFEAATGDFVLAFCDDHMLRPDWDAALVAEYLDHEKNNPILCLGARQVAQIGTVFGKPYAYFPFMRAAAITAVGGFFDPGYCSNWGDCDLGLRVWSTGGRVEFSRRIVIDITRDDERPRPSPETGDMVVFLNRWGAKYGDGYDLSHVRGFNLDVPFS
jgi:hypothetical protein